MAKGVPESTGWEVETPEQRQESLNYTKQPARMKQLHMSRFRTISKMYEVEKGKVQISEVTCVLVYHPSALEEDTRNWK